ncbi:unnamed protein product [Peniophora sp. CBMAI 1063]|nr:unnamed protein product [Peniophora sp. CBMAI 1063]
MGQRYLLVNADKQERHGAVDGHMHEFIFGGLEPVAKLLTIPVQRQSMPESCLSHEGTQRSSLGSLCLPTELLDLIFARLDIMDAFCLAVANSLLCEISWRHVCRKRDALVSSWADDRIVCLSDYADSVPPPLSTPNLATPNSTSQPTQTELNYTSASRFTSVGTVRKIGIPSIALCDIVLERMMNVRDIKRCGMLLGATEPWYPADRAWALANISRRQYILAQDVGMLTDHVVEGPFVQSDWNLGNVVVALTAWSGSGKGSGKGAVGCRRVEGMWAGERVRICTVESLVGDWEDVSSEVVPLVGRFLEGMYAGDVMEDYADYYGPSI